MLSTFQTMGPFAWPLLIIAVANLAMIGLRARDLYGSGAASDARLGARINAVLFWGVVALLLGYLSQYAGLYLSMTAIAQLDGVSTGLVAKGIAESIMATIFGLVIMVLSSIAWFLLRARHRSLAA